MTPEEVAAREAIRDLVARYNANGDAGRFDDVVALFAPDAVMELPNGEVLEGREAIAAGWGVLDLLRVHEDAVAPLLNEYASRGGDVAAVARAGGAFLGAAGPAFVGTLLWGVGMGVHESVMAAAVVAMVAWPIANAMAWAPYNRLYLNALGGGKPNAGRLFPPDEIYDLGVREAAEYVCRVAPRGARVASPAPAAVCGADCRVHDLPAVVVPGRAWPRVASGTLSPGAASRVSAAVVRGLLAAAVVRELLAASAISPAACAVSRRDRARFGWPVRGPGTVSAERSCARSAGRRELAGPVVSSRAACSARCGPA